MPRSQPTRRDVMRAIGATAFSAMPAGASVPNVLDTVRAGTAVPGMGAMVLRGFHAQREIVSGVRRIGTKNAIARGDRWHLGSDGKAMTATTIARLVERGVLDWSTPLEHMLPSLAEGMHPEYRDVVLPDLLSHRSGLPQNPKDQNYLIEFVNNPTPLPQQRLRYVTTALAEAPAVPKWMKASYSNTGYIIAAVIAEQATGQSFETLMAENLFRPLLMKSCSYVKFGGQDEPIGHVDGRVADQKYDPNPPVLAPSDGMRISLSDWSRFCIDHMAGEHGRGTLLRKETYQFLHAPQGDTHCALGWMTQASIDGRKGPVILHSGSDGNWMALAVLFPQIGDGVLVTANSAYSMDGNFAADAAVRALTQNISSPAAPVL